MKRAHILAAAVAVLAAAPAWAKDAVPTAWTPATYTGPAAFKDADSPWLDGHEFRLAGGIDAPEIMQPCTKNGVVWFAGQYATVAVNAMFAGKTLVCVETEMRKSHGRPLVKCTVDGQDIEPQIVRAGWAFDYPHYSHGHFAKAEEQARKAGLGIHAGTCEKPWEWRHRMWGKK